MPKKLIVNADGFGFGAGATQGIFDAINEGMFISSVSVNANFGEAHRIKELAQEYPQLSIGVHLNPMVGEPCLSPRLVPSLVDSNGNFHGNSFPHLLRKKMISFTELENEFDAQISKIRELVGDRVTHLDSQANRHLMYFDLFLGIARKWGINRMRNNASLICMESFNPDLSRLLAYIKNPHVWMVHRYRRYQMKRARKFGMRMADYLITVGYSRQGNKTNYDNWYRVIKNLSEGVSEIYCHPAYPDATLSRWARYNKEREEELKILRQKKLRGIAKESGVELISFSDI